MKTDELQALLSKQSGYKRVHASLNMSKSRFLKKQHSVQFLKIEEVLLTPHSSTIQAGY